MKILAKLVLAFTLFCGVAFATSVTPINIPTAVERNDTITSSQKRILTGSDGFPRIAYLTEVDTPSSLSTLVFVKCNDAACGSQTSNVVYTTVTGVSSSSGCILLEPLSSSIAYFSMSLTTAGLPRFAVLGLNGTCGGAKGQGVGYIECADAACSSSTFTLLDTTDFQKDVSIATSTGDVSTLLYQAISGSNFIINSGTCSAHACNAPTTLASTVNTNVLEISSLYLATDQTLRFAYYVGPSGTTGSIHYYSNGTDTAAITVPRRMRLDIGLGADGFANIAWMQTNAGTTVQFAHCNNDTCSSVTSTTTFSATFTAGRTPSVVVPTSNTVYALASTIPTVGCSTDPCLQGVVIKVTVTPGFARIGIPVVGNTGLSQFWGIQYITCTNTDCSANSNDQLVPPSGFIHPSDVSLAASSVSSDFTITATPGAQLVLPGGSVNYSITIAPISGFTGDVTLTVGGLPSGTTFAVIAPSIITGGTGTSTMTVTTTTATPHGVYPLVITGTSGSLTHTATVTLDVLLQKPKFVSRKIIDLIGDNPQVVVPVRSKDGKIPFSYYLIEHPVAFTFQNQWLINTQMTGVSSPSLVDYAPVYLPDPPPGSPAITPLPAYTQTITDSLALNPSAITIGTPVANLGWFYIDASYTSHFFNVTGTSGAALLTDGSGYTLTASGSASVICQTPPCPTIVDTAGNTVANNQNVDPTFQGNVASFTDPAGIKLTALAVGDPSQTVIYTDTMGYVALMAAETNAKSKPPNDPRPTNVYTYVDAGGSPRQFTVLYALFYQSTNFGCPGISEMPRTPAFLPVQVTLPDRSFYLIGYEPTPGGAGDVTGRIAVVVAPNGGRTTYQYGGANSGVNCDDGSIPSLVVKNADGGVWTYTHVLQ